MKYGAIVRNVKIFSIWFMWHWIQCNIIRNVANKVFHFTDLSRVQFHPFSLLLLLYGLIFVAHSLVAQNPTRDMLGQYILNGKCWFRKNALFLINFPYFFSCFVYWYEVRLVVLKPFGKPLHLVEIVYWY